MAETGTAAALPIPHREPFLFVGEALELREDEGLFAWVLPRGGETWGLRIFPELLAVEAMAQAAAAFHGLRQAAAGGPPEAGALASVDRVRFNGRVRPGDPLKIKVRRKRSWAGLVMLDGEVWVHHRMVAAGELVVRRGEG